MGLIEGWSKSNSGAETNLPNSRINTIRVQEEGGDVMSAQTHGQCLLGQLCKVST